MGRLRDIVATIFLSLAGGAAVATPASIGEPAMQRPNVLLIVADDVGFSDLGSYGSEIPTPSLDELAAGGTVFSGFYASPMCSPTRAMLLSGMDHHVAGVGTLQAKIAPNQEGNAGYQGHLRDDVAALPEVFRAAGYRTYMTGKWHLGESRQQSPAARGFDHSFILAESGASHFADMLSLSSPEPAIYREDGEPVRELPDDFYSSRFYATRMLDYLREGEADDRPFFAYLAFTAAHFPLQAPDDAVARQAGRYDRGYQWLRQERLAGLQRSGILTDKPTVFPRLRGEPEWSQLSDRERRISARRMEIYAAMIAEMDRQTGRVLDYLDAKGELDNTIIVFISDNGAEGHRLEDGLLPLLEWSQRCCDNSLENMGRPGSYVMLGPDWAQAAQGPLRMFKGFTGEGGLRVPAIVRYPGTVEPGAIYRDPVFVMDIMPTLLQWCGIEPPAPVFQGRGVLPLQGRNLAGRLSGRTPAATDNDPYTMGWELLGKRAWRRGDWKLVWRPVQETWSDRIPDSGPERWQLYNLARDPGETRDMADQERERTDAMAQEWEGWRQQRGVVLPDRIHGY